MADIMKLKPFLVKWEGTFVNHPLDRGGATNVGVTLVTFRSFYGANKTAEDLRKMTDAQWSNILRKGYWGPCQGDKITNQSIANIIVDFAWASGTGNAIRKIQRLFGLTPDGVVGEKTLSVLNGPNKETIFNRIKEYRLKYVNSIVENNHSQIVFLRGWQNRINDLKFSK